jgi:hypothetical protein
MENTRTSVDNHAGLFSLALISIMYGFGEVSQIKCLSACMMPEGKGNTKLARVGEGGISIKIGKPHMKRKRDPLRNVGKPGICFLQSPSWIKVKSPPGTAAFVSAQFTVNDGDPVNSV